MRTRIKFSRLKFTELGIRTKLLCSFIILVSMPVIIIAGRSYNTSSSLIEAKTNQYSHDILYQTTKTMETRLDKIEDISLNIITNQEVQSMLLRADAGNLDDYTASQFRSRMETILASHVLFHDEINAVYVVSTGDYVYELDKTKQNYGIMGTHLEEIMEASGSVVWFGGLKDGNVVALTRLINSLRTQKPIAYLVMYVEERFLCELLNSTLSAPQGNVFLVDGSDIIVSHEDKELLGTFAPEIRLIETRSYSFSRQEIGGIPQYMACSAQMKNGWRVVLTIPIRVYQMEILNLRNDIITMALIVLIMSSMCALWISSTISSPIRRLSDKMAAFGEGDFTVRYPTASKDEIGKLASSFNLMAENINALIQKVYDEQLMKRDAQLKSLQMQINPHFLYNTLETINWMARAHGTEDVAVMAKSLGDLMRFTISKKDFVTLGEEIRSLNNYFQIQKFRYGDKFDATLSIDDNTRHLYIPKLIIQPLVENAIYHGLEPAYGGGVIRVKSRIRDNVLLIDVSDNGVGIPQESVEKLLNPAGELDYDDNQSIGIQNVIKRVQTMFGNGYGLVIQSEIGEGTTITIKLPVTDIYPSD